MSSRFTFGSRARVCRERMPFVSGAIREFDPCWQSRQTLVPAFPVFRFGGHEVRENVRLAPDRVAFVQHPLTQDDRFDNVGANCGGCACFAAHLAKPVIAVELLEFDLRLLKQNLPTNSFANRVGEYPRGLCGRPYLNTIYGTRTGALLSDGWCGIPSGSAGTISLSTFGNALGSRLAGQGSLILFDVEGYPPARNVQAMIGTNSR